MPVQTDAAHTHEVVISGPSPPSSAACSINVMGPAKEIITAMNPAFQAEKEESFQASANRCIKQGSRILQEKSVVARGFK